MGSRLPPMPRISEIVKLYRLSATKKLSQNFLLDMNVCHKFVNCISVTKGSHICEVGPGPGGITRALLESDAEKVHVIEKDKRFLPPLEVSIDRAYIINLFKYACVVSLKNLSYPFNFQKLSDFFIFLIGCRYMYHIFLCSCLKSTIIYFQNC